MNANEVVVFKMAPGTGFISHHINLSWREHHDEYPPHLACIGSRDGADSLSTR